MKEITTQLYNFYKIMCVCVWFSGIQNVKKKDLDLIITKVYGCTLMITTVPDLEYAGH